jgi:hypothetical protein
MYHGLLVVCRKRLLSEVGKNRFLPNRALYARSHDDSSNSGDDV